MALSAAQIWEVRTTGSDNNGGAFKAGATGTDRSQQDAAQVAIDNSTITTSIAANVITFVTGYTPSAADVGNVVQMLTGTNVTAGFYEITAISVGSKTWTVTGAATLPTSGTTTNATGNMGGALATLGKVVAAWVTSNKCYVKAGTYSTGSQIDTGTTAGGYIIEGYQTTRGDLGTKPILQASAAIGLFKPRAVSTAPLVRNLEFDGNSTGTTGIVPTTFNSNVGIVLDRCYVHGFSTAGMSGSTSQVVTAINCRFSANGIGVGNTSAGDVILQAVGCEFDANTGCGVQRLTSGSVLIDCLLYGNGSTGAEHGMNGTFLHVNCTTYNNGAGGFGSAVANTRNTIYVNCAAYGNTGGYGFGTTTSDTALAYYCATGSNTSGAFNNVTQAAGNVALSADPFVAKASNNFALNSTAGGGAACRAVGIPGAFPRATTTGYLDIGAAQHQDAGGGGVVKFAGDGGGFVG